MHDRVDIMVDLETLGTGMNAGIIQLGAVAIYDDGTTEECNYYCKPDGDIDTETLQWWLKTNPELLKSILEKAEDNSEYYLLARFCDWVDRLWAQEKYLWSNGSEFDIAIIRHKIKPVPHSLKLDIPFYHDRDLRTILEIAAKLSKMDEKEYKKHLRDIIGNNPRPHDALGDAQFQAKELEIVMKEIEERSSQMMPTLYDAYCREQEQALEKRPHCGECGEPIQSEDMYVIDGICYCPECIESHRTYIYDED